MRVRDHVPQYYRWLKFRTIGRTVSSFIYTQHHREIYTQRYMIHATNYSRLQPVKVHHGVQLLGVATIPAKGWAFSSHLGSLVSAADLQTPSPEAPVKMGRFPLPWLFQAGYVHGLDQTLQVRATPLQCQYPMFMNSAFFKPASVPG